MKRINDNKQHFIINSDYPDTALALTPLKENGTIAIEILSKYGEKTFTLDQAAIDFMVNLLNTSKRH